MPTTAPLRIAAPSAYLPPGGIKVPVSEQWWHERSDDIVCLGYELRCRCTSRSSWRPTWLKLGTHLLASEEVQSRCQSGIVRDAIRIRDGLPVILKRVLPVESPHELTINQSFSSQELAQRSDNHCVPMLGVVNMQRSGSHQLMVFPHLRPFYQSRLRTFEEFFVFITQICEGIQFMHQRDTAYGNCTVGHIMFDPSGMTPNDWFDPSRINQSLNIMRRVKRRVTRTHVYPRYYLTDLGSSRQYPPQNGPDRSSRSGEVSTPESRLDGLNDPFRMDIYCLGNLVRENFMQKYRGFEFLRDLVDEMTDANPERRPTIEQVAETLMRANRSLSEVKLRSTFVLKDTGLTWTMRLLRTVLYYLGRRPTIVVP